MRTPKRVYSQPALEAWFERLQADWEATIPPLALEQGRAWYREGEVRQLELSADDAIIHRRVDKQETYALVEWKEGIPAVRASTEDRHVAYALAAAGLYEIEELVADEIPALPRERAGAAKAEAPAAPEPEARPAARAVDRKLVLRLRSTKHGLELSARWRGEGGDDHPALAVGPRKGPELTDREREKLIRLTSLLRKAGFETGVRRDAYHLAEPSRIGNFLRADLAAWKQAFEVDVDPKVEHLRRGVQRLAVEATVQRDPVGGLRFHWKVRLGSRTLGLETLREVLRAGVQKVLLLPELGLVRVDEDQADILGEWRPFIEAGDGAALPPYLVFSLFGQDRVKLDLAAELKAWRDALQRPPPEDVPLPAFLRPYQQRGVRWMRHLTVNGCHALLADEMGLGKTIQVGTLLATWPDPERPCLIVSPASVVPVWQAELARFFPELRVEVLKSGHGFASAPGPRVWLASYTQLRRNRDELDRVEFSTAVLDEAQFIKNPEAKVTAACLAIRARSRVALTGTPLENRHLDLWTLFQFLMPGLLGGRAAFERLLAEDAELLEKRLRRQIAPFVLRRTKKDVITELPPKVEMELLCPLTDLQLREYGRLAAEGLQNLGEDLQRAVRERTISLFTLLTRLRQVCCDPDLLPWLKADLAQSGKISFLLAKSREILAGGHKIVVFSQFTTLLRRVREGLEQEFPGLPVFELTGKTLDRARPISGFQGSEGAGVMLVSLRAGGTGITLHAADYVFILDPWWNPAVEEQAVDRVHRIGQERTVFVYRMITQGTIEERIGQLKAAKREVFHQLVGDLGDMSDFRQYFSTLSDLIALTPAAPESSGQ